MNETLSALEPVATTLDTPHLPEAEIRAAYPIYIEKCGEYREIRFCIPGEVIDSIGVFGKAAFYARMTLLLWRAIRQQVFSPL